MARSQTLLSRNQIGIGGLFRIVRQCFQSLGALQKLVEKGPKRMSFGSMILMPL